MDTPLLGVVVTDVGAPAAVDGTAMGQMPLLGLPSKALPNSRSMKGQRPPSHQHLSVLLLSMLPQEWVLVEVRPSPEWTVSPGHPALGQWYWRCGGSQVS